MSDIISANNQVLAHVTIKLADGSVADSTKVSDQPSWLILGDGSFSEAFEERLFGSSLGDVLTFELDAADAFGESNPDNIHFMDITLFPQDIVLEKGGIVGFEQPGGGEIPGIIREVQGASVKVDFNHPLAGEKVVFELEILAVKSL